mmetsp:Transcript_125683/g.221272  ORF Transcript_125683/g.221272 Transcript_125683/m.221272 type:complete len:155 (-) Transcript_125683:257-721(-)
MRLNNGELDELTESLIAKCATATILEKFSAEVQTQTGCHEELQTCQTKARQESTTLHKQHSMVTQNMHSDLAKMSLLRDSSIIVQHCCAMFMHGTVLSLVTVQGIILVILRDFRLRNFTSLKCLVIATSSSPCCNISPYKSVLLVIRKLSTIVR